MEKPAAPLAEPRRLGRRPDRAPCEVSRHKGHLATHPLALRPSPTPDPGTAGPQKSGGGGAAREWRPEEAAAEVQQDISLAQSAPGAGVGEPGTRRAWTEPAAGATAALRARVRTSARACRASARYRARGRAGGANASRSLRGRVGSAPGCRLRLRAARPPPRWRGPVGQAARSLFVGYPPQLQ